MTNRISPPPLGKRPLVSVLVANYNYEAFLAEALESLTNQTYEAFEAIVCDDGSTDESVEVIERFSARDPRIRLIRQANAGQASALNRAFSESTGEIIVILDADDTNAPDRLEKIVEALQSSGAGVCVHRVFLIDGESRSLGKVLPDRLDEGWLYDEAVSNGGRCSLPPASGLSFRRDVADAMFPIPLIFRRAADAYIAGIVQLVSEFVAINEPLAGYRLHGANITGLFDSSLPSIENILEDLHRSRDAQKEFLKRSGDAAGAARLTLFDSPAYLDHVLARALLKGEPPALDGDVWSKFPPWRKRLWLGLFRLPRPVALRAFNWWWSDSKSKRVLKAILRR